MIFSWLDTPDQNLPQISGGDAFYTFLSILNDIPIIGETAFNTIAGQALNKRLGTEGLSYPEIIAKAAEKGIDIGELFSIPEKEEWVYEDGRSYVC